MAQRHLDDAHLFEAGNLREPIAMAAPMHHQNVDDDNVAFFIKHPEESENDIERAPALFALRTCALRFE